LISMISIVLVQPFHPGNVGAVARAMANFGLKNLLIIDPLCDPLCEEARKRSTHGLHILEAAKIVKMNELKKFDCLVATTSRLGTDYNIPRNPVTPRQMVELLPKKKSKIAILFGRESDGLRNEEIALCDFIVTIPSEKDVPALNISHAVAIVCYEIFNAGLSDGLSVSSHIPLATAKEKEVLMRLLNDTLKKLDFVTDTKRDTQRKVWKRMIGKSFLTKREAFALMGYLRKTADAATHKKRTRKESSN
jgi:tRNA/rRNA methyltransferase